MKGAKQEKPVIEFNIAADVLELEKLLDIIKRSGIREARVNVGVERDSLENVATIPQMRLKHIAQVLHRLLTGREGVPRNELLDALVADGLKHSTANVYVSGASGARIIIRNAKGYALTPAGEHILKD